MSNQNPPEDLPIEDLPVEEYARLAALARTMREDDFVLEEPPGDLWSRIEQRVAALEPADVAVPDNEIPAAGEIAPSGEITPPVELAARRRRRWTRPALAAAAAVAVIGGVTAVVVSRDDEPNEIAVVDLSNAGLDPRGQDSHGTATVIRLDDGRYALDVDVADLPSDADGFFELWVIDPNVEGMVSLGPLHNGRVVLPSGVDPQAFPIVDISIEPVDGVPTHSGDSILRGQIQA
jgi:hypothetical protein